ncbi:MAG: hypothetical protein OEM61_13080, partial [Desulfobacteraceae bacterium]|nr:hypothetical protein [Desulfobacteraceae bacterium]
PIHYGIPLGYSNIKVLRNAYIRAIHDGHVVFCPVSAGIQLRMCNEVNTDFFGLHQSSYVRQGRSVY